MRLDEAFLSFWEDIFCSEGLCGIAELSRGKSNGEGKYSAVTFSFSNKSWQYVVLSAARIAWQ